jgi:hypothetical protein
VTVKSGFDKGTHTKEVPRYREALLHGFKQIKMRPLCANLSIEDGIDMSRIRVDFVS